MLRLAARYALILTLALTGAACGDDNDTPTGPDLGIPYSATDLVVGTGNPATLGRTITVTYTGWLYSTTAPENKGTQFDQNLTGFSYVHGTGVIAGFTQGINGMRVGGSRRIIIPPSLGYGSVGTTGIPGNSTLIFEIALTAAQF